VFPSFSWIYQEWNFCEALNLTSHLPIVKNTHGCLIFEDDAKQGIFSKQQPPLIVYFAFVNWHKV